MTIFTDEDVAAFKHDFPSLSSDVIAREMRRVETRSAEKSIGNPKGYLRPILEELSKHRWHENQPATPKNRGSFAEDGSFNPNANSPSPTEQALREFADTCSRLKLPPADAAEVLARLPLAAACFRPGGLLLMPRLNGIQPEDCTRPASSLSWLESAWACTVTSTSGEEFVKREILSALKRELLGEISRPAPVRYDLVEADESVSRQARDFAADFAQG